MNRYAKFYLYAMFFLLFTGCADSREVIMKKDKESREFQLLDSKLKCIVSLTLNREKNKIYSISSGCMKNRDVKQSIKDIKQLIEYYKMQDILENTSIIRLTLYQKTTTFPTLIRYYNRQEGTIADVLKYDRKKDLRNISLAHFKKLAKLIKNSNIYNDALKIFSDNKNCNFTLDFSYWEKDSGLRTVPKAVNKYIVEMDGVLKKEDINFEEYPNIEYFPIRVECRKLKSK